MTVWRLRLSDRTVDLEHAVVITEDDRLPLTQTETSALRYLGERANLEVSRQALEREVWGFRAGVRSEAVPVAMRRLRQKMEPDPSAPRHLLTVPGTGWKLVVTEVEAASLLQGAGQREGEAGAPGPRLDRDLPTWLDRFVGREAERRVLARSVEDHRLVSLLGPGGVGKTRLACEWAQQAPWPVCFVDLSAEGDAARARSAVARALGLSAEHGDRTVDVGARLAQLGPLLLLVDNCEQVEALAADLAAWLAAAPQLRILATSRRPLGVRGEQRLQLAPLSDAETAQALFLERARAVDPWLELDDPTARAAVAELVQLLDGLPLALELAAARVAVLSPRDLLERAHQHLGLLRDGDRVPRHRTLKESLDWSWRLLPPWAAGAMAQLSVFEGPFSLAAAEAVLELDSWPDAPPLELDAVQTLIEHSLLDRRPGRGAPLRLLRAVRDYARRHGEDGQLRGAAQRIEAALRPHAQRVRERGSWLRASEQLELAAAVRDLEACSARALAEGRVGEACAFGAAAITARGFVGPQQAGLDLAAVLRAAPGASGDDLAVVMLAEARIRRVLDSADVLLMLGRDAGQLAADPTLQLQAALVETLASLRRSEPDRLRVADDTLDRARAMGSPPLLGEALVLRCGVLRSLGRPDQAIADVLEARACFEAAAYPVGVALALGNLAVHHGARDELDQAMACFDRVEELLRAVPFSTRLAGLRMNRGNLLGRSGRLDEAREALESALDLARRTGHRQDQALITGNLGSLAMEQGDPRRARDLYEQAVTACEAGGWRVQAVGFLASRGLAEARLGQLEQARRSVQDAAERADSLGAALTALQVHLVRVRIEREHGDGDRAAAAVDEVRHRAADLPLEGTALGQEVAEAIGEPR